MAMVVNGTSQFSARVVGFGSWRYLLWEGEDRLLEGLAAQAMLSCHLGTVGASIITDIMVPHS